MLLRKTSRRLSKSPELSCPSRPMPRGPELSPSPTTSRNSRYVKQNLFLGNGNFLYESSSMIIKVSKENLQDLMIYFIFRRSTPSARLALTRDCSASARRRLGKLRPMICPSRARSKTICTFLQKQNKPFIEVLKCCVDIVHNDGKEELLIMIYKGH